MKMKMKRLLWMILVVLLAGCAEQAAQEAARQTQRAVVTATQQAAQTQEAARQYTATQQVVDATVVALNLNIIRSEGTVQAAAQTAEVYRGYQTGTAQYHAAVATSQAQFLAATQTMRSELQTQLAAQTATQQAWVLTGWTATARAAQATTTTESRATQQRWTQQAIDRVATADAAYVMAVATAQAAQAGLAENALERERSTRFLTALAPFALGAVLIFLLIVALSNWARFRVVQRDANGVSPVIILDGRVVNPDRGVTPVLDPRERPQLPGPGEQLRVTENEQKVQAVRALSASDAQRARGVARQMTTPQAGPGEMMSVQVIPAREVSEWVRDVTPVVYREAMEEEGHEPER